MEELKKQRLQKKYSFNDMAKLLNISKTYYWQLEHNQRRISYDMAFKIAALFDKKPDDLFYQEYLDNKKE